MTETKDQSDKTARPGERKPLTLQRTVESGHVRQNFSHGRSKSVVVEKKKTRKLSGPGNEPERAAPEPVVVAPVARPVPPRTGVTPPKAAATEAPRAGQARNLSDAERDARATALAAARERAVDDEKLRVEVIARQAVIEAETSASAAAAAALAPQPAPETGKPNAPPAVSGPSIAAGAPISGGSAAMVSGVAASAATAAPSTSTPVPVSNPPVGAPARGPAPSSSAPGFAPGPRPATGRGGPPLRDVRENRDGPRDARPMSPRPPQAANTAWQPREGGRPQEIRFPAAPRPFRPGPMPAAPDPATEVTKTSRAPRPVVTTQVQEDDDGRGAKRGGPGKDKVVRAPVKAVDDRRERVKLTINNAFDEKSRERSLASLKRKREREKLKAMGIPQTREKIVREVIIPEVITIQEL